MSYNHWMVYYILVGSIFSFFVIYKIMVHLIINRVLDVMKYATSQWVPLLGNLVSFPWSFYCPQRKRTIYLGKKYSPVQAFQSVTHRQPNKYSFWADYRDKGKNRDSNTLTPKLKQKILGGGGVRCSRNPYRLEFQNKASCFLGA